MRTHLVAAIGLTFCAVLGVPSGCGSGAAEGVATKGEAISASLTPHYYTLRHAEVSCTLTLCQAGYALAEVDGAGPERMARKLDFSSAHLDDGAIGAALEAPDGELVLYGAFDPATETSVVFDVRAAFRGMPGVQVSVDDGFFFKVGDLHVATRLETGESEALTSLSVEQAARFRVDQAWLADRVLHHGAIVQGTFRDGVLDAGQVYDPLPDHGGPCLLPYHHCAAPAAPVYTRDVNRCLVFQGCQGPRVCPDFRPGPCEDGYSTVRWASAGPACWSEVCDPAFLAE